jgi:hypothetical protein
MLTDTTVANLTHGLSNLIKRVVIQWQKVLGGAGKDCATSVIEDNNGYIVAGLTSSIGHGDNDCWIFKLDYSWKILYTTISIYNFCIL